jgi:nucleoside-diphosphate-sugar epimerase
LKILITGASGYIGSKLVNQLISDYDVVGLDLERNVESPCTFVQGDVRNKELMKKVVIGKDCVIHLAAVVPPSPLEPEMENINFRATCCLSQICREKGVKQFIYSSTCSVYPSGDNLDEEVVPQVYNPTAHAPNTPYVSGKIKSENFVQSIRTDFFNPVILRFATVFGKGVKVGWQSLFNDFVKTAYTNKELEIKHPNAYRPFCHVDDIVEGIKLVLKQPMDITSGEIYNIGGINLTKNKLANLIQEKLPDVKIKDFGGKELGYNVNFDKIHYLGLKIKKQPNQGIDELIEVLQYGT